MTPSALASPVTSETAVAPGQASRALRLGLAVFSVALPLLILAQYLLPEGYQARYWGLNPRGMMQFRAHLGLTHLAALTPETYSLLFQCHC